MRGLELGILQDRLRYPEPLTRHHRHESMEPAVRLTDYGTNRKSGFTFDLSERAAPNSGEDESDWHPRGGNESQDTGCGRETRQWHGLPAFQAPGRAVMRGLLLTGFVASL